MSKTVRLPRDAREATHRAALEWLLAMSMTNGLIEAQRRAEDASPYDRAEVLRIHALRQDAWDTERRARDRLTDLLAEGADQR